MYRYVLVATLVAAFILGLLLGYLSHDPLSASACSRAEERYLDAAAIASQPQAHLNLLWSAANAKCHWTTDLLPNTDREPECNPAIPRIPACTPR